MLMLEKNNIENVQMELEKEEWEMPSYEEFKFSGCMLNGPSAS